MSHSPPSLFKLVLPSPYFFCFLSPSSLSFLAVSPSSLNRSSPLTDDLLVTATGSAWDTVFLLEQKLWATGTFAVFTAWREPAKLTSTVQACQWTKHLQFFLLPAAHVLIKIP